MNVGDIVLRIASIADASGFTEAERALENFNKKVQRLLQPPKIDLLGYTLGQTLVSAQKINNTLAQMAVNVSQRLKNLAGGLFNLINPLNAVGTAMNSIGNIAQFAFGVLLGNVLTSLTQKALAFAQSFSPLETAILAGQIDTKFRALAITASNAGKSFKEVADGVDTLRYGGIEAGEALQSISQGLQMDIPIEDLKRLSRAAQDMAVVIGSNSTEAFQRLFRGIATGQVEMLRFAGIMKTTEQFAQDYAVKIGKTSREVMFNVELRRKAMLEGVIAEASKFSGAYEGAMQELGKRLSSLPRIINDIQIGFGQMFVPLVTGGVGGLETLLEYMGRLFNVTKKQAQEVAAKKILGDFSGSADAFKKLNEGYTKLGVLQNSLGKNSKEAAAEQDKLNKTITDIISKNPGIKLTADNIRALGEAGKFSDQTIRDVGGYMNPSDFAVQIFALNTVLGEGLESGAKMILKKFLGSTSDNFGQLVQDAIVWGIDFTGNLAIGLIEGVTNFILPAVMFIAETIASFLETHSPTDEGPLSTLDTWGQGIPAAIADGMNSGVGSVTDAAGNIADGIAGELDSSDLNVLKFWETGRSISRNLLEGLKSEDFSQLDFLGNFVKSLTGSTNAKDVTALKNIEEGRSIMAKVISDISTLGSVSSDNKGALQEILGSSFGDMMKYLEALIAVNQETALQKKEDEELKLAKKEIEEGNDKILDSEERLRNFEKATADIPERYTRGRKAQLMTELDAAKKEEDAKKRALTFKEREIQNRREETKGLKENLNTQKQILQEILRGAEARAKIDSLTPKTKTATPTLEDAINRLKDAAAKPIEIFRKKWNEMMDEMKTPLDTLSKKWNEMIDPKGDFMKNLDKIVHEIIPSMIRGWDAIKKIWDDAKPFLDQLWKILQDPNVQKGIMLLIGAKFADDALLGIPHTVLGALITAVFTGAGGTIGKAATSTINVGISLVGAIWSALGTAAAATILEALLTGAVVGAAAAGITIALYLAANWATSGALQKEMDKWFSGERTYQLKTVWEAEGLQGIADIIKDFTNRLNYLVNSNPLNAIISAPAALATRALEGLLELFEKFTGIEIPDWMTKILGAAKDASKSVWTDLGDSIGENVQASFDNMGNAGEESMNNNGIADAFSKHVSEPIKKAAQNVYDELFGQSIFPDLVDGIVGLFTDAPNRLSPVLNNVSRLFVAVFDRMADTLRGTFEYIGNIMDELVNRMWDAMNNIASAIGSLSGELGGLRDSLASFGSFDLSGMSSQIGGEAQDNSSRSVTVDQTGWTFPADMSGEQQETLREIARTETYNGLVAAFRYNGTGMVAI